MTFWEELAGLGMMSLSVGIVLGLIVKMILGTIPGMGGQVPPRPDQQTRPQPWVPVSPGGNPIARVTEVIITPGGALEGIFTYSSSPPAAGTLIETAGIQAAGTDPYGNHFVPGHASYAGSFATALNAGFVQFYSGSLAGGWTATGSIAANVLGDIAIFAAAGRQVITTNQTLDDGAGNMAIAGSLTIAGSSNTGSGNNGGVTSGPSGTVNAFPAAGPNHTHTEIHQHPL